MAHQHILNLPSASSLMCFFYNVLFDVLIAVFVSDDPFILSSWDESGNDSTLQHRSEQTSIITSPRAPIGNKSEINHSAMQVTTDQFILVHTVYHFYHFLLAHCDFILWPKRNHLVDLYVCNASHYYSSLAQTIHNNYQILLAYCDSIVWPILTFQVRNYPLMHIDGTTAWYICWPSTSPSFCCYTGHVYYEYYIFFSYTEWLWAVHILNHQAECQQHTYVTSKINNKAENKSLAPSQHERSEEILHRMCKAHNYPVTLWAPQRLDLVLVSYEWCVYICTLWCK